MSKTTDIAYMRALMVAVNRIHQEERLKAQADERRKAWEARKLCGLQAEHS